MSDETIFQEYDSKPMVTNFKGYVRNVKRQYETDAPSIPHAFQKDAIQNAVGARPSNSWSGWRCEIKVVESEILGEIRRVLVVSDYGTTGLRGKNYTNADILVLSNNQYLSEHPEENLARISSASNSGGNNMGGGLFGVGKTLYSIASKEETCTYYFESVSIEGYRASRNKIGMLPDKAYEGEEAKQWWKKFVGLEPRTEVGTSFIIIDPTDEIIDAIQDGTMLQDVEETWWRIIPMCLGENEGIFVNGQKAKVPPQYLPTYERTLISNDYDKPVYADEDHLFRVTKYGIHLVDEELPELLCGFYYYRKGMKICEINTDVVPEKLRRKFFGYIEVDDAWEDDLKRLESDTHYGMTKKQSKVFGVLRNFVQTVCEDWLSANNLIKTKESEDRRLRRLLDNASEIIQDFYSEQKYDPLGQGDTKKKLIVTWRGVQYPNPDEDRTVHTNDVFRYSFDISSKYLVEKDCLLTVEIENAFGKRELLSKKLKINPGERIVFDNQTIAITPELFERNEVNYLIVRAKVGAITIEKKKLLYYDIETKKNADEDFSLTVDRVFPRIGRRRVNPDEAITGIVEHLHNNLEKPVKLRLLVTTFNVATKQPIETIYETTVTVDADSVLDVPCPDIVFLKEVYDDAVGKGQVEIRSRLTVAEDCKPYPKGFKAAKFDFIAFYNTGEKRGAENAFKAVPVKNTERHATSWIDGKSGSWQISVNIGHPEYLRIDNDEDALNYFIKEQNRQFVYIYMKDSNYSIIGMTEDEMSEADPVMIMSKIEETVQENWWAICQK